MGETVLVADHDPKILRFVDVNLRLEGFEVLLAEDGEQALRMTIERLPDLVLLDARLPVIDGVEVCRRLRADARTSHTPIILLSTRSMTADKVVGLTSGADDYVLKPFDPLELTARVRTTLRRTAELRTTSPLTGLPGNHRLQAEIATRLDAGYPLALIYADLNGFKAYNDRYGFLRGDDVIALTGRILVDALQEHCGSAGFAGHIGGDDFMLLCAPSQVPAVCEAVIAEFDRAIPALYDPDDAARGYLEVRDRQGVMQRYPVTSIALGVATTERRWFSDHREMVVVATEMKGYLKQRSRGSAYAVDGRTDEVTARADRARKRREQAQADEAGAG